ncbi:MAG TPA: site-specific integrase [Rhizomicrobium sp.]
MLYSVHKRFSASIVRRRFFSTDGATFPFMTPALFDLRGNRKYLVARERFAFVCAASREPDDVSTFCLALAFTGARVSEVLALTASRIDAANEAIVFETLKQRRKMTYRAVPVPRGLMPLLLRYSVGREGRLWPWGRTTAWKVVKRVMRKAEIAESLSKPKALRHAFAVEAGQKGIPLNIVQRWLGHARIETTAIYASAIGDEERNLARRAWSSLELALRNQNNLSAQRLS